jgi:hypothetical protein
MLFTGKYFLALMLSHSIYGSAKKDSCIYIYVCVCITMYITSMFPSTIILCLYLQLDPMFLGTDYTPTLLKQDRYIFYTILHFSNLFSFILSFSSCRPYRFLIYLQMIEMLPSKFKLIENGNIKGLLMMAPHCILIWFLQMLW